MPPHEGLTKVRTRSYANSVTNFLHHGRQRFLAGATGRSVDKPHQSPGRNHRCGGTVLANRLVRRLERATIIVIDQCVADLYQPGLVATGLEPAEYVVSQTTDWLPHGVDLVAERVVTVDPII